MLKSVVRYVAFLAMAVAVAWVYSEPQKYDAWVAAVGALVVFLGSFFPSSKPAATQHQEVQADAYGIQAGRDVKINVNEKRDR
jgi:hypothetical protein